MERRLRVLPPDPPFRPSAGLGRWPECGAQGKTGARLQDEGRTLPGSSGQHSATGHGSLVVPPQNAEPTSTRPEAHLDSGPMQRSRWLRRAPGQLGLVSWDLSLHEACSLPRSPPVPPPAPRRVSGVGGDRLHLFQPATASSRGDRRSQALSPAEQVTLRGAQAAGPRPSREAAASPPGEPLGGDVSASGAEEPSVPRGPAGGGFRQRCRALVSGARPFEALRGHPSPLRHSPGPPRPSGLPF